MSTRRPKSVLDQDRYTAELSTGQLVIGVCILLMFGLGCFLLGVLIGKFDPTLENKIAQTDTANPSNGRATEVKVIEPAAPPISAAASDPGISVQPPAEFRAPSRILASGDSGSASSTPPGPAVESPATGATPVATDAPAVGESVQAEAEHNRVSPPSAQPQTVAAAPDGPGETSTSEPAATAASEPKPAAPSATPSEGWKGHGVQVMAVSRGSAETALKKLQASSSYTGRVLPPARGDLHRVVVGPFADRSAAMKAREDLLARGYKGAFVLRLQ